MTNRLDVVMSAFAPTIDYPLDEGSSPYENQGVGGALDLDWETGLNEPWIQAPGIVRGAPYTYGIWGGAQKQLFTASDGVSPDAGYPTRSTFTTGTFAVWVLGFSDLKGDEWTPLSLSYVSGINFSVSNMARFEIDHTNGRITFLCGTSGNPNSAEAETATGVFANGVPMLITATQRGDSTGIHIHVNGVDVTDATAFGANGTIDSFVDVLVNSTDGALMVNGYPSGATTGFSAFDQGQGIIQRPAIWENDPLSDAQIMQLYTAGALANAPQDYYEFILDRYIVDSYNAFYWVPGFVPGGSADFIQGGDLDASGHERVNITNSASANLTETDRVSAYVNYKQRFGGNTNFAAGGADLGALSQGTVIILLTLNSFVRVSPDPAFQWMWDWGEGVQAIEENVGFALGGTSLGTTLIFTAGEVGVDNVPSGDYWRAVILPADGAFPLADSTPVFAMITVTQDGNGLKIYRDGEEVSEYTVSNVGTTYDENAWFSALISPSSPSFAMGFTAGSSATNNMGDNITGDGQDVHDVLVLDRAITADEVAEHWDAVKGIFPAEARGAWATLLQNTGNGAEDNGPGPDWWWRNNAESSPIIDVGIAQNRTVGAINANSIATGGDPLFEVTGPLPEDLTNKAIYFDGLGDYFEIGVNGVTGQLVNVSTGTIGGFFSKNAQEDENIFYSQANDAYTAFWTWGLNGDRVELIVQTSAGNSVTLTSSIDIADNLFHLFVLTCDGANYRLYIDEAEDTNFLIGVEGTGAEGDWFDAFTADNSAMAARGDSGFTTETTGRLSEPFIYDGEVLSSTEIMALAEAAIEDGITGSAAQSGVVVFENVTFRNGANADIRVENDGADFLQVLQVNRGKFLNGAQGSDTYQPQAVLLTGQVHAHFRGCLADLQDTPSFGRGGIVGTQVDPSGVSSADGSILVSDCDFEAMGFLDGTDFLAPVMCHAGFGMTVDDSRFKNCLGTAIGWRADAQRVSVVNNQINGTTQALGAIHSAQGLNTRLGNGWVIRGNKAIDTDGNAYSIDGDNFDSTGLARNIIIAGNEADESEVAYQITRIADAILERNNADGCFEGVRVGACQSSIAVKRNGVLNHTGTAYIAAEGTVQLMDLTLDRNKADGAGVGDGLHVGNVRSVVITYNDLQNMDTGIQVGEIAIEGVLARNDVTANNPFIQTALTTQNGFKVGVNNLRVSGGYTSLLVDSDTLQVYQHHHEISPDPGVELATINGPNVDGWLLNLRLTAFGEDITILDSTSLGGDNLFLNGASDILFDEDNDNVWLVQRDGNWYELQQQLF